MAKCGCGKPSCINCLMEEAPNKKEPTFKVYEDTYALIIVVRPNEYLEKHQKEGIHLALADVAKTMKAIKYLIEPLGLYMTISGKDKP